MDLSFGGEFSTGKEDSEENKVQETPVNTENINLPTPETVKPKLPDANAFNSHVEKLFVSTDLSSPMEIQLLEIMAESGTAFSQTLETYRYVILILFSFSSICSLSLSIVVLKPIYWCYFSLLQNFTFHLL